MYTSRVGCCPRMPASSQEMNVLLQLPLVNPDVLVPDDPVHLLRRQAIPEDLQRVLRGSTVDQLLPAVRHLEQVHVVRVAETAHDDLDAEAARRGHPTSRLRERFHVILPAVPDLGETTDDLGLVLARQEITVELVVDAPHL